MCELIKYAYHWDYLVSHNAVLLLLLLLFQKRYAEMLSVDRFNSILVFGIFLSDCRMRQRCSFGEQCQQIIQTGTQTGRRVACHCR